MSEKVRTGIYISEDLLRECDEYISKNGGSRSELIESALRLYLARQLKVPTFNNYEKMIRQLSPDIPCGHANSKPQFMWLILKISG